MGGSPTSPSEVLRTVTGAGGPKHLGGSVTVDLVGWEFLEPSAGGVGEKKVVAVG